MKTAFHSMGFIFNRKSDYSYPIFSIFERRLKSKFRILIFNLPIYRLIREIVTTLFLLRIFNIYSVRIWFIAIKVHFNKKKYSSYAITPYQWRVVGHFVWLLYFLFLKPRFCRIFVRVFFCCFHFDSVYCQYGNFNQEKTWRLDKNHIWPTELRYKNTPMISSKWNEEKIQLSLIRRMFDCLLKEEILRGVYVSRFDILCVFKIVCQCL